MVFSRGAALCPFGLRHIGELGMGSIIKSFLRLNYLHSLEIDGYCCSEGTARGLRSYVKIRWLRREHDVDIYGYPVSRFLRQDVISEERSSKEQNRLGPHKLFYVSGYQREWPGSPQQEEEKEKRIMAEYERKLQHEYGLTQQQIQVHSL